MLSGRRNLSEDKGHERPRSDHNSNCGHRDYLYVSMLAKMTKPAEIWKEKDQNGRVSWKVICGGCDRMVILQTDSVTDVPSTKRCAICVREIDKARWAKVRK